MGAGASKPAAVFSSLDEAEHWVAAHRLSGLVTEYILDRPHLDWAVEGGLYQPQPGWETDTWLRETFAAGAMHHVHFTNGRRM